MGLVTEVGNQEGKVVVPCIIANISKQFFFGKESFQVGKLYFKFSSDVKACNPSFKNN